MDLPHSHWTNEENVALKNHIQSLPDSEIMKRVQHIHSDILREMILDDRNACIAIADDDVVTKLDECANERELTREKEKKEKMKQKFLASAGSIFESLVDQLEVYIKHEKNVVDSDDESVSCTSSIHSYIESYIYTLMVEQNGILRVCVHRAYETEYDTYGMDRGHRMSASSMHISDSEITATEKDTPSRAEWIGAVKSYFRKNTPIPIESPPRKKRKRNDDDNDDNDDES